MTNCKQSSELSSESLDHRLSILQWLKLHLHISLCPFCKRFGEHISILRNFCSKFGETAHEQKFVAGLSEEARQKIKRALKEKK